MAPSDNGISKDSASTGVALIAIIVFISLALYNVAELTFIIFATFKKRGGLYFWSFVVATWGIAPYAIGFLVKALQFNNLNWVYVTLIVIGWCSMVTGQSVVLYSRLHIVVHSAKRLRAVLYMIIADAIICHVPIIVMVYGANSSNPEPFVTPYSVYEKVQVTVFFIQEIIISSLYIYETVKLLRVQRGIRGNTNSKKLMAHLIIVNIIIVFLDITILALEYAGLYDIQTSYKALVYSVKLKLEFSILNRLVELIQGTSGGGGSSYARTRGDGMHLETFDGERQRKRNTHGVGYKTYVRSGQEAGDAPPTGSNVVMTTEIVVKRDSIHLEAGSGPDGESTDGKSAVLGDVELGADGVGEKKRVASSSSSSEIQFAGLGY